MVAEQCERVIFTLARGCRVGRTVERVIFTLARGCQCGRTFPTQLFPIFVSFFRIFFCCGSFAVVLLLWFCWMARLPWRRMRRWRRRSGCIRRARSGRCSRRILMHAITVNTLALVTPDQLEHVGCWHDEFVDLSIREFDGFCGLGKLHDLLFIGVFDTCFGTGLLGALD